MMHIKKNPTGDLFAELAGPWWMSLRDEAGERHVYLKCTQGHVGGLSTHTIAEDGRVTPSVVCEGETGREGCTFHEFVKLEEWEVEQ